MKALFFALVLPGLLWAGDKPNLVFILADDLGYGDVQGLNPQRGKIATPHLDRLAAQGMTFTDAHSGSSVCTPTRYGLLTGRHAWRTRLQRGVLDGGNDEPLIAADRLTVAGLLRDHGYATACIGKWHLGFQSDAPAARKRAKAAMGKGGLPVGARILGGPTTRGFEVFFGCSNARTMGSLIEGDRVTESLENVEVLPRLAQRAEAWLEERAAQQGKPFFLYLPLTSPHTPIVPSAEWRGKSGLGEYGDFVQMTDAVVGEVLGTLDRLGLADDTLVLFSADNGCSPQAGTDRLEKLGHFASERFRGYKADIWEGGHRVPLLVRWPAQIAAGSVQVQPVCLTDFLATCADLLEIQLPADAGEDSVSFLPLLLGQASEVQPRALIHHSIDGRFAVRDGPWKLCFCAGSGGWGSPKDREAETRGLPSLQLYHLGEDPGETRNLVAEHPEIVERLQAVLREAIDRGRSTPGGQQANDVEVHAPGLRQP
jgi:arylsulfatase A